MISSFDIISIVLLCEVEIEGCLPDPNILLCVPASAAGTATGNPNGTKTLLANGLITFFIRGNHVFSNRPRSQSKNPSDSITLNTVISVDKKFTKALRRFPTCLLVDNN